MNKIIKMLILAISVIIIICIYDSMKLESNAAMAISREEYTNNPNLYCTQKGQDLSNTNYYDEYGYINITGNDIEYNGETYPGTVTDKASLMLAYIFNKEYDNVGGTKQDSKKANAIWAILAGSPGWQGIGGGFFVGNYGSGAGDDWVAEAQKYADNYYGNTALVDNTNKTGINTSAVPVGINGGLYLQMGPFNWTVGNGVKDITISDQNGQPIGGKILYTHGEGWGGREQIVSGADFLIAVPLNENISMITNISVKTSTTVYTGNINMLKNSKSSGQNLMLAYGGSTNQEKTVVLTYNISTKGNLEIIKFNKDNNSIPLQGVGFKVAMHVNGVGEMFVVSSGGEIRYTKNSKYATEFITNANGRIYINGLLSNAVYNLYETKNPNYGYELIPGYTGVYVRTRKQNTSAIANKQIFVKLSGRTWLDAYQDKPWARDNLYYGEPAIPGIKVRLKHFNGATIKETTTNWAGEYLFVDVLISELPNYYIEFEYNGLKYENVSPLITYTNGSKAMEYSSTRAVFNNNFATIEGNGRTTGFTRDLYGTPIHNLSYSLGKNTSTNINYIDWYPIISNTYATGYNIRNNFTYGQSEIQNINLGLYEREQPDIALINDLENVKVAVNGKEYTYQYSQRFINQVAYGDGFNVEVKFGSKYSDMSYTRAIYKSDYEYINETNKNKELKVYITYRIALKNQSTNLKTRINSIIDYYDSKYNLVSVGTGLNQNGTTNNNLGRTVYGYNSGYNKLVINTNSLLEQQQNNNIYVQFELGRQAVENIIKDKSILNNVAEINTYSVYDGWGNVYAGIDKDSNPANCIPGDKNTYEDDTDAAPTLKLEVTNAREIAGKVFLDATSGELKTGQIRQANGKYDSEEIGINNVKITLKENTGSGKIYETTTNTSGDFIIPGYIPGDYTLTYTWGDNTYTVQNYKGTIYDSTRNQGDTKWYKTDVATRKTDALDNYTKRKEIDSKMNYLNNTYMNNNSYTQINPNEKLDAITPIMVMGVEYNDTAVASTGIPYLYKVSNVDFGIVERARQELEITKRVKRAKVTLANGQVIIDVEIDEKGNITGNRKYFIHLPKSTGSEPKNGLIKIELDNEILQGSLLDIEYEFKAKNNSELDYDNQEYYLYGIQKGNKVTISAEGIIDYLDRNWAFEKEKNPGWEIKSLSELQNLVSTSVTIDENMKKGDKIILYTKNLKKELEPKEESTTVLAVSKVLTRTDDISLDNETEIIEIGRQKGGSKPKQIPGNYIPGKGPEEVDSSQAERVIVTPSTGGNLNYIIPIGTITILVIIIGVGIVVIKKKVI